MQLLVREGYNQEGVQPRNLQQIFMFIWNNIIPTRSLWISWTWLLGCRRVEPDLNPDRGSLLFFCSEDLSNAAAPTKPAAGDQRGDTPCKCDANLASPFDVSVQIQLWEIL